MARKLSAYRAKRDFTITGEPSGSEDAAAPADYPRFVIQKHAASHLHLDLRLEVGGVFRSWAVTKGPSSDPADKRFAVEVEDHPLEYGDFEGTIPKGEYGGGTVMLWNRGFWTPENGEPKAALRKGELKFTVARSKMKGSWVLVRMGHDRTGKGRKNWLLIKHRDAYAKKMAGPSDRDRSVASKRSLTHIASGKGAAPAPFVMARHQVKADAVWNSDKKSMPGTKAKSNRRASIELPEFIAPQLCKLIDRPPTGDDWVHEIKLDGYRMQLRVTDGSRAADA